MKYTLIIFLLFGSSLSAQTKLKILTYNIFHGEQAYEKGMPNIDDVAALINKIKPDLAAFQEVDSATGRSAGIYKTPLDFIHALAKKTGMHGFFGKAMDYDGGGYGEGLLSRKPATATVKILPTPEGGEPRALIYITYTAGKKKIVFAGTHLCHEHNGNRVAQVKEITATFATTTDPVVLCGDLNFIPTNEPYGILQTAWDDAAALKGDPQNTFPSDLPRYRLDYAWLKKGTKWKVVNVETLPVRFSDHKPVLITLEIE